MSEIEPNNEPVVGEPETPQEHLRRYAPRRRQFEYLLRKNISCLPHKQLLSIIKRLPSTDKLTIAPELAACITQSGVGKSRPNADCRKGVAALLRPAPAANQSPFLCAEEAGNTDGITK